MPDKNSRTLKEIYKELVSTPFFPLLFIAEAIKVSVVEFTSIEPMIVYSILAVIATIMWAISDTVDVDVNVTNKGFFK